MPVGEINLRDEPQQQQRHYSDEEKLAGPKVHFLLSEIDHDDKQDGQIDQELKHRKDFDDTDEEAKYNFKSDAYRSFEEGPHRTGQYQKSSRIQPSTAKEEELPGIAPEDIDLMTNFFSLDNQIGRKETKMHSYLEADRPLLVVDTGSYNEELEKCFQGRSFLPEKSPILGICTFKFLEISNKQVSSAMIETIRFFHSAHEVLHVSDFSSCNVW